MLTLICGIPNAGKTTYSAQYDNVIHLDDANDCRQCNAQCGIASRVNEDICVEGVYNQAWQRKALIEACQNQSPKVCIWLDTPLEECLERERNGRNRVLATVRLHHKILEPPTYDEGWDEIIRIGE